MGVLHLYFNAANAEAAFRANLASPLVAFTTVESKVADPAVVLGHLVALIAKVPWTAGLIGGTLVSPNPATKPASAEAYAQLPEDSPWRTGPWLQEFSIRTRNILAELDTSRHVELAAQWGRLNEFRHIPDNEKAFLTQLVLDFSDLAKQARGADHRIYCWSSL